MREESLSMDLAQLPALRSRGSRLTAIGDQIRELRLSLDATAEQSAAMVGEVRRLHTARARVNEVLTRVDQLVALERCKQSVDDALQRNDFETAVEQVLRCNYRLIAT